MKWHAPPKWARWTCHTSYNCLETHFIEKTRLKVVWVASGCFKMFQDVSRWEIWATMEWHAPPKWPRWTCDTSHKCLGTHFIENQRLKVVWFQEVSRSFEMFRDRKSGSPWTDTRHQNDPGKPVIRATIFWKPMSLRTRCWKWSKWFQDVSKCFGIGNLGHYEMTRATKMSPMNLSYELQLFGNPFHRDTPGRFAGNRIHPRLHMFLLYVI